MPDVMPSYYADGTATVAAGGTTVTGQGTLWAQAVRAGDLFGTHVGMPTRILSVDSDTQLTLAHEWAGPAQDAEPYEIQFTPYYVAFRRQLQLLLELQKSGNVEALAGLEGAADLLPIFTGPGAMGLINKAELIQGVHFDAEVDTLAERAQYDDEADGFVVLVADVGDGRAAIYYKVSAATADWSAPAYITGPIGPLPDVTVGDTTTLPPGDPATVTPTPTPTGVELDFGIPAGEGFYWRGEYNAGTAYQKDDVVRNNGSTWIALQATTGNAPPVLPTTSNDWWELVAPKGQDGEGTGDVVGPASATPDNVALFDGDTGKLIKDGFPVTAFMQGLLATDDAAAARADLGLGTASLEDYESGIWTPTVTFTTPGNLNVAYSDRGGHFVRIGNLVVVTYSVITSTFTYSTASGGLLISGLPYLGVAGTGFTAGSGELDFDGLSLAPNRTVVAARVLSGSDITFRQSGSGVSNLNVTDSHTESGTNLRLVGTISYRTEV